MKKGRNRKAGTRPPVPLTEGEVLAPAAGPETFFHDGRLLAACRTKWQYGDWQSVAALTEEEIARDSDRAKLAALVAAAHAQGGQVEPARHFMRLAQQWGCDRRLIARLMISGAHNLLGSVAAALGEPEEGLDHARQAVVLVEPQAEADLLARTRFVRELARRGMVGLAQEIIGAELERVAGEGAKGPSQKELDEVRALVAAIGTPALAPAVESVGTTPKPPLYNAPVLARLSAMTGAEAEGRIYLEVKSLPQSGLHYLRNTLAGILGPALTFCEWYNEPGCCNRMPCTHHGLLGSGDGLRLRMVNSHDFGLSDPDYPVGGVIQRPVLIRDPLFLLTSWWNLHLLQLNRVLLEEHGINMAKINDRHEAAVVAKAHGIISDHAALPEAAVLSAWLDEKGRYVSRFLAKWGGGTGGSEILPYRQIRPYIDRLLSPHEDRLDKEARRRLSRYLDASEGAEFIPRATAFSGPTPRLTAHLETYADLFRRTDEAIRAGDETGVLALLDRP